MRNWQIFRTSEMMAQIKPSGKARNVKLSSCRTWILPCDCSSVLINAIYYVLRHETASMCMHSVVAVEGKRLTGSRPEEVRTGLGSGPWGVAYKQLGLCSAAVEFLIWVKYPAGTEFIGGLESPVLKKSVLTAENIFFCGHESPDTAPLPEAGEIPLGIRIILRTKCTKTRESDAKETLLLRKSRL